MKVEENVARKDITEVLKNKIFMYYKDLEEGKVQLEAPEQPAGKKKGKKKNK